MTYLSILFALLVPSVENSIPVRSELMTQGLEVGKDIVGELVGDVAYSSVAYVIGISAAIDSLFF